VSTSVFDIRFTELYDVLRNDPFYGDDVRVKELVIKLERQLRRPDQILDLNKKELLQAPPPGSTEQRRYVYDPLSNPQSVLIQILVELAGLNVWHLYYGRLGPQRIRQMSYISDHRFYTTSDELERLLRRLNLLLPESIFPSVPVMTSQKKLRRSQRHKEQCRVVAERLWREDPNTTIQDMIFSDEITRDGCEGKVYAEKTLRKWINDLCPNRRPGRRPKAR
jgi:hypothetical protein